MLASAVMLTLFPLWVLMRNNMLYLVFELLQYAVVRILRAGPQAGNPHLFSEL